MASELDQAGNGGLGLGFVLSEIRDFRKGLEARDERINGALDGLRDDVTHLSKALIKSQDHVSIIDNDVKALRQDVHAVRTDVDSIIQERDAERVRSESSWAGPKKVARNLILAAAAVGAIGALITFFGPSIAPLLIP